MITELKKLAAKLESEVRSFTDVAVVGISGGVDSATVASISVAALGAQNVYLLSMPYDTNDRNTFNARSTELADQLKANHLVLEVGTASDALISTFKQGGASIFDKVDGLHRLTSGNTRARMRMSMLYAVAGELSYRFHEPHFSPGDKPDNSKVISKRVRVMGTGNASEDLIGYDTKGGDALADLFPIGDLFKSEVYQLAKHYNVPKSILEAPPSAGLYPGQTDKDELGFEYDELEAALRALHKAIASGKLDNELSVKLSEFSGVQTEHAEFVIKRFKANAHKHRAPAVVQVRYSGLVD